MKTARYPIGTQFIRRSNRKNKYVETVTDILTTTNQSGEVVKIEYLTTHEFCGQPVMDTALDATISLGEIISHDS